MTVTKFLIFAIIIAILSPAGREMLDELARGFSSAKPQVARDFTSDSRDASRRTSP
jgi:hypothetical protein